jgi:hypothetical protein
VVQAAGPGCVPATTDGLTQSFAPRRCPYAVPTGSTPMSNPEYMVRYSNGLHALQLLFDMDASAFSPC